MKSGTVKLMGDKGGVRKKEKYNSENHREEIISRWKKLFPNKAYLTIQIVPDIGNPKLREVCVNKKHFEPDPPKPKFIRPPAVYQNTGRSLYP